MSVLEIIAAILLILACIFIILVVLMQDSKQGMSQTITGASGDNYYQKNSGRTKEAKLAKMTKGAAVIVFIVALIVNLFTIYGWGKTDSSSSGTTTTTAAVTTAADDEADGSEEGENTAEEDSELSDADETEAEGDGEDAEETEAAAE